MTQDEIKQFLHQGAFVRIDEQQVRLYWGPFAESSSNYDLTVQEFFSKAPQLLRAEKTSTLSIVELQNSLKSFYESPKLTFSNLNFKTPDFELFKTSFQLVQGKIQRQEIEKAVPIGCCSLPKTPTLTDRCAMMLQLLMSPRDVWAYGFWDEQNGILGATPEILFYKKAGQLHSMALAGTCPKSEIKDRKPLLKDEKELREHHLVVTDIRTVFQKWGIVKQSPVEVVEFPTMLHLRTRISVDVAQVDPLEVTKLLHPTPALGVAPRNYGYRWLIDLPYQKERRWFGAPLGFQLEGNDFLSLVAIRNLQWDAQQSWVNAGCGIVSGSELEREWRELFGKLLATHKMLGISD
jgi:menaquinone-specific isochorismate synthase